jgi:hypothetical protein
VKEHDRQAEEIMILVTVHFRESLAVKFGRGIFRNTDAATKDPLPVFDLEGIAIHELDKALLGDQYIFLIHVSHNMPV